MDKAAACKAVTRRFDSDTGLYARLAQLAEHLVHTEKVGGSEPSARTVAVAQLVERLVVIQVVADSSSAGHPLEGAADGDASRLESGSGWKARGSIPPPSAIFLREGHWCAALSYKQRKRVLSPSGHRSERSAGSDSLLPYSHADVAQVVEQGLHTAKVRGSTPLVGTHGKCLRGVNGRVTVMSFAAGESALREGS